MLFFIVVVVVALMIPYKLVQRRQPFTTLRIQQRFADKFGDVINVSDPPNELHRVLLPATGYRLPVLLL